MDVPVRELKDRLSEYLRRVQAGEEVVVTSHGRAIVRMVAVGPAPIDEAEALARLRVQAWVRAGDGSRRDAAQGPRVATESGKPSVSDLLVEDRA